MPAVRKNKTLVCTHGLRRPALVQSLLTDIFQGKLKPGQRLIAQELGRRFGVSQTPIREALIELAGIGVLDLLPNRGALVRKVTAKDVRDFMQVRRALECQATRSACGRIDLTELHDLAQELRGLLTGPPGVLPEYLSKARNTDNRLHDLIALSCGNDFLAKELNRLKILFRAFRDAFTDSRKRVDFCRLADEAREHLAIVEALQAGKAKDASQAMALHLRGGVKYWTRTLPA